MRFSTSIINCQVLISRPRSVDLGIGFEIVLDSTHFPSPRSYRAPFVVGQDAPLALAYRARMPSGKPAVESGSTSA
jgi:hypothetical protein